MPKENYFDKAELEARLLPCPCCGKQPEIERWIDEDGCRSPHYVWFMKIECECGIQTFADQVSDSHHDYGLCQSYPMLPIAVENLVIIWNKRVL